jgi:hypothetical protein
MLFNQTRRTMEDRRSKAMASYLVVLTHAHTHAHYMHGVHWHTHKLTVPLVRV